MYDNDKNYRFMVRPGIAYVWYSVLGIIPAIALLLLDSHYYVIILIAFIMGGYNFWIYITVRIFVFRDYFVVRDVLRQSKQYAFDEVQLLDQGIGWNGYRGFVIKDSNGRKILTIGDYYTNIDELLKALKKKKASKPQQNSKKR